MPTHPDPTPLLVALKAIAGPPSEQRAWCQEQGVLVVVDAKLRQYVARMALTLWQWQAALAKDERE